MKLKVITGLIICDFPPQFHITTKLLEKLGDEVGVVDDFHTVANIVARDVAPLVANRAHNAIALLHE